MRIVIVLVIVVYGYINALTYKKVNLEFSSEKITGNYRIAQLSDVHLGSRTRKHLKMLLSAITEKQVDLILITGDLYDGRNLKMEDFLPLKSVGIPIYFVEGNHEQYANSDKIREILKECGVKTLNNQTALFRELHLIGIADTQDESFIKEFLSDNSYNDHYSIFLQHSPVGFDFAANNKIDLMLSGHTHNGQIFPFNYLVKLAYRHSYGIYHNSGSKLYVTSGSGTWGPVLRIGSRNELVFIDLSPEMVD